MKLNHAGNYEPIMVQLCPQKTKYIKSLKDYTIEQLEDADED